MTRGFVEAVGRRLDQFRLVAAPLQHLPESRLRPSRKTGSRTGRVTQESLNVSLPPNPGKYLLVFSNKFSLLTPKAVQADITLAYYTR
jgi:hypothetical protein